MKNKSERFFEADASRRIFNEALQNIEQEVRKHSQGVFKGDNEEMNYSKNRIIVKIADLFGNKIETN